jgi:DNA-binding transcriptional ArsR family regulator
MTDHTLQLDDEPDLLEVGLPAVLAALSDPGRLSAVRGLAEVGEAACGQLQPLIGTDWSKSTLSHHLRVLREAGITHTRVAGTRRFVSLRHDDLESAFPGLLGAVLNTSS